MCCFFTALVFFGPRLGFLVYWLLVPVRVTTAFATLIFLAGWPDGPDLCPLDRIDVRDDLPLEWLRLDLARVGIDVRYLQLRRRLSQPPAGARLYRPVN